MIRSLYRAQDRRRFVEPPRRTPWRHDPFAVPGAGRHYPYRFESRRIHCCVAGRRWPALGGFFRRAVRSV